MEADACYITPSAGVSEVLSARGPLSARDFKYQRLSSEVSEAGDASKSNLHTLNVCTLIMILISAVGDTIEVHAASNELRTHLSPLYKMKELFLCIGLFVEFCIRLKLKGCRFLRCASKSGQPRIWPIFQVLLLVIQIGEAALITREWWLGKGLPTGVSIRMVFRLSSVLMILRAFNILDQLDVTTELHLLLTSMRGSLLSLSWSALFILVPMFVFGMGLTQAVTDFRVNSGKDEVDLHDLVSYFGTLDRSMLTLFWAISGGLSWSEATRPLSTCGFVWTGVTFVLYVASMTFATVNVLTGVFVNSATAAATSEQERQILQMLKKRFVEFDYDMSGNLTQGEFAELLKHKDIALCLQSLDIRPAQASHLFDLIDANQSGVVEIDEFLKGCDRLQGNLKAIDFATFLFDFANLKADMQLFMRPMGEYTGQRELVPTHGGRREAAERIACLPASRR